MALEIREDDLEGEAVRALVGYHLRGMLSTSPAEYSFALDLSALRTPDITVWSVWRHGSLAGIGALKDHGAGLGELKSMRTHPDHLRQGVAAALLEHVIETARARGLTRLSLETGSGQPFDAALALYRKRGFVDGDPFADYRASPFNQFLHLDL